MNLNSKKTSIFCLSYPFLYIYMDLFSCYEINDTYVSFLMSFSK